MSAETPPLTRFREFADGCRPSLASLLQRPRRRVFSWTSRLRWSALAAGLLVLAAAPLTWRSAPAPAPVASRLAFEVPSDRWFTGFATDAGTSLGASPWPTPGRALSATEE